MLLLLTLVNTTLFYNAGTRPAFRQNDMSKIQSSYMRAVGTFSALGILRTAITRPTKRCCNKRIFRLLLLLSVLSGFVSCCACCKLISRCPFCTLLLQQDSHQHGLELLSRILLGLHLLFPTD